MYPVQITINSTVEGTQCDKDEGGEAYSSADNTSVGVDNRMAKPLGKALIRPSQTLITNILVSFTHPETMAYSSNSLQYPDWYICYRQNYTAYTSKLKQMQTYSKNIYFI